MVRMDFVHMLSPRFEIRQITHNFFKSPCKKRWIFKNVILHAMVKINWKNSALNFPFFCNLRLWNFHVESACTWIRKARLLWVLISRIGVHFQSIQFSILYVLLACLKEMLLIMRNLQLTSNRKLRVGETWLKPHIVYMAILNDRYDAEVNK